MNRFLKFAPLLLLALAVMLSTTGCKSSQDQTASNTGQASTPDQSQDPAAANLAPVSTAATAAPSDASSAQQSAPPPDSAAYYQQVSNQAPDDDDSDYGEQPAYTAPDPPPALPDYDQTPAMAISGPPVTGTTLQPAITGCPAFGFRRPTRVRSGHPATGVL